jgi:hypothetical protein
VLTNAKPAEPELISDRLRRLLGVPSREAQQAQIKYWQEQYHAAVKGK